MLSASFFSVQVGEIQETKGQIRQIIGHYTKKIQNHLSSCLLEVQDF